MTQDMVLQTGSAVVECGFMYDYELDWAKDYGTRWYRSKDRKGGKSPYAGSSGSGSRQMTILVLFLRGDLRKK